MLHGMTLPSLWSVDLSYRKLLLSFFLAKWLDFLGHIRFYAVRHRGFLG